MSNLQLKFQSNNNISANNFYSKTQSLLYHSKTIYKLNYEYIFLLRRMDCLSMDPWRYYMQLSFCKRFTQEKTTLKSHCSELQLILSFLRVQSMSQCFWIRTKHHVMFHALDVYNTAFYHSYPKVACPCIKLLQHNSNITPLIFFSILILILYQCSLFIFIVADEKDLKQHQMNVPK